MQPLLNIPRPKLARLEYGLSSAERAARWKKWQAEGYDGIDVDIFGAAFGPTWPQRKVHSLDFLADFPRLKALAVRVSALKTLTPLSFPADSLEWLAIGVDPAKLSCEPIGQCRKLKSLAVGGLLVDLNAIQALQGIAALSLYEYTFKAIELVQPLKSLQRLWISGGSLQDLEPIGELPKLKALELMMVRQTEDLSPLSSVKTLQYLALGDMKKVTAMPDCSQLSVLRRVYLDTMNGINDLSGLTKAPDLEELIVVGSKIEAAVFEPIISYHKLKRVTVGLASRTATKEINAKLGSRAFNLFGTSNEKITLK